MDWKTFIFGMVMLVLAPVLWPVSMLLPDRAEVEARRLEKETECRKLILEACRQQDLEWATELAAYWTGIDPGASGPREIGVIVGSTLSEDRKLEAVARIAGRGLGASP